MRNKSLLPNYLFFYELKHLCLQRQTFSNLTKQWSHCSWSRLCDVCTIKLLYFLDFRLVISKNLIKIEHTGITESGGQECKVVTLWEGGRFSGKCLLLINIKTSGRFFSNFCRLFKKPVFLIAPQDFERFWLLSALKYHPFNSLFQNLIGLYSTSF